VEDVLPVLDDREAGGKRERTERCIGGGKDGTVCDGHEKELATEKRFWAEVNVGDGGYLQFVEGSAEARRTERAPRPQVPGECAEATTTARKCKQNIESKLGVLCFRFHFPSLLEYVMGVVHRVS
jgi:hypothetical protein